MKRPIEKKWKSFAARALLAAVACLLAPHGLRASAQGAFEAKALEQLIEKLDFARARSQENESWALSLRLADAIAERARRRSIDEIEKGCEPCAAGDQDRARALSIYDRNWARAPRSEQARLLLQIGHLHDLAGNGAQAASAFQLAANHALNNGAMLDPASRRDALLALGDLRFRAARFAEAKPLYAELAQADAGAMRGFAAYRWAWCEFRAGKADRASGILKSLLLEPPRGVELDEQFREAASRDFATFLAQGAHPEEGLDALWNASPSRAKYENFIYFSSELDRLGRAAEARQALARLASLERDPPRRLVALAKAARLDIESLSLEAQGRAAAARNEQARASAANAILEAAPLAVRLSAVADVEAKEALRDVLGAWQKKEGESASRELGRALDAYASAYPADFDAALAAAKAAMDVRDYKGAFERYQRAGLAASSGGPAASAVLEQALLGELDAAERRRDPPSIDRACDAYLAASRDRSRALEAKYRKARLAYERGDYAAAADALRAVTVAPDAGPALLRSQAADLSLDALALLNDHRKIEAWGQEYAQRFPVRAPEYKSLARKAVLHQSAALAANDAALAALSRFDPEGASASERAAFCKNRLVLLERARKFGEASAAADCVLAERGASEADRDYALERKAWIAELGLDFGSALAALEQKKFKSQGEAALKLALFSELSGRDAKPYLEQFAKAAPESERAPAVAARLARESADPLAEMRRYSKALKRAPALRGEIYLEAIAADARAEGALRDALRDQEAMAAPSGAAIRRIALWRDVDGARSALERDALDASTQRRLASGLKSRLAKLERLDSVAQKALESGEWGAQVLALDAVANQRSRFYAELQALPVPAGLSVSEQATYRELLAQQADPHKRQGDAARAKLAEFWQDAGAISTLSARLALRKTPAGGRAEAADKARAERLAALAPPEVRAKLDEQSIAAAKRDIEPPSAAQRQADRDAVRSDPFNRERLERLMATERQAGNSAMAEYAASRIQALVAEAPQLNAEAGGAKGKK